MMQIDTLLSVTSTLLMSSLVTLSGGTSVLFYKQLDYKDLTFNDYVILDVTAWTTSDCARQCSGLATCVTFTYVTADSGASKPCRGFSSYVTSLNKSATSAPAAVTFSRLKTAPQNLALHKTASQSSTYSDSAANGIAAYAVDGNSANTVYAADSCSSTTSTGDRWWQVDMHTPVSVYSVTLTNRGDCCGERLREVDIAVYGEDPAVNSAAPASLCQRYAGPMAAGATRDLPCVTAPVTGRYVRVTSRDPNSNCLTLCEVQVMAVLGE